MTDEGGIALERPLVFECEGERLYGILHGVVPGADGLGVLVVVGGPQTRVGSHRQFVLLARALALQGISVLRFDYRGMGDSEGEMRSFEDVHEDIERALDAFLAAQPGLSGAVLWGLCDAATAASFYAPQDPRVKGLVLVNPWARTEQGEARVMLGRYYVDRLFSRGLWKKIFCGQFDPRASFSSLLTFLRRALARSSSGGRPPTASTAGRATPGPAARPLPDRLLSSLQRFRGPVLVILSGRDLTAAEFARVAAGSRPWRRLMGAARVSQRRLEDADHTFSSARWRDQVASWTLEWVKALDRG